MEELEVLEDIALRYFSLSHIPFSINKLEIMCPIDVYLFRDLTEVSLDILKELISNTDRYVKLCSKDGTYLLKLTVGGLDIRYQVGIFYSK